MGGSSESSRNSGTKEDRSKELENGQEGSVKRKENYDSIPKIPLYVRV